MFNSLRWRMSKFELEMERRLKLMVIQRHSIFWKDVLHFMPSKKLIAIDGRVGASTIVVQIDGCIV
ncbi:hypothetical protein CCR75_000668 [Bremia lactucae]|uniref:Uncharacterized protein n=1 Tax=Bremia lactucae TaxID=4779 RepID=A0A976IBP9_BRELC|nr:hypothetical protein CCR75_000668 [Bremia lactucae]